MITNAPVMAPAREINGKHAKTRYGSELKTQSVPAYGAIPRGSSHGWSGLGPRKGRTRWETTAVLGRVQTGAATLRKRETSVSPIESASVGSMRRGSFGRPGSLSEGFGSGSGPR